MTQELLGRVHRELIDVLNSINQDKIHHDGDDFHELLNDVEKALAQPEQKPVAWPCRIDIADFSENTIMLVMQCEDYKVSAGTHWLSTTPPQRTEQEPVACIGTNGELMWLNKPRVIYSKPQPLYTTPPHRKPLTDEEIILIVAECAASHQHTDIHFARAIERAHGIKELV